jgi:hypothetical protein
MFQITTIPEHEGKLITFMMYANGKTANVCLNANSFKDYESTVATVQSTLTCLAKYCFEKEEK